MLIQVLRGLASSLSIAAGYLPIAFGFGLTALQAGLSPLSTALTSVIVFAGASQFVLVALLTSGAGMLSIVGTITMMNARHLFYGPTLRPWLLADRRRLPTPLLAFGLTDEVFATALGQREKLPPEQRQAWFLGLQLGAYSAWVGGTLLAIVFGPGLGELPPVAEAILEFILPALFFVLLLEVGVRHWAGVIALTLVATLALSAFLPGYHALVLGMLAGAAANLPERKA